MGALLQYIETGRHGQFMYRAKEDPAMVLALPPRHPYHTLLDEKPDLTTFEAGDSSKSTRVASCSFADQGPTFVVRPVFADAQATEIYMHEYTAFSLWGYLVEYIEVFDKMSGPTEGGMH